ncbi:MAG TPA: hypothetical protein VGL60_03575 [Acidimicrobiales bacterium]|jgi:hypothetical protein
MAPDIPYDPDRFPPDEPRPPVLGARPSPVEDPSTGEAERAVRRELLGRIESVSFPATRNDLLRAIGPDDRSPLHAHLRALPPDLEFANAQQVVAAFGAMGPQS